ncbi:hypothetical protein BHU11_10300 [Tannerella sp. oral taxon 808]|nr:hypothetical protein BHU11_10300 [Tannerella sp. oral taxon 808]
MRNESIREDPNILHHVGGRRAQRMQGIERRGRKTAVAERIEHIHILAKARSALLCSFAAPARRDGCILSLGVNHDRRSGIEEQVGNDQRNALVATGPGNREQVPIVAPTDHPALACAQHHTGRRVPHVANHFVSPQPARCQATVQPDSLLLTVEPPREILLQRRLELSLLVSHRSHHLPSAFEILC